MSKPTINPPRKRTPSLPERDGIAASSLVLPPVVPGQTSARIAEFLIARFPAIPATEWQARMAAGDVRDEHGAPITPDSPYQANLRVYYYRSLPPESPIPFQEQIVFQDAHLIVADKPHFLPVTPAGKYLQETLLIRLRKRLGLADLSPIHRIDRETAGLVVFCVQPTERGRYQSLFEQRSVSKSYEAIAPFRDDLALPMHYRSRLAEDPLRFMQMRELAGEPNAETEISLITRLAHKPALAHYHLNPITGRKHQLRAQLSAIGTRISRCPPGSTLSHIAANAAAGSRMCSKL